MAESPPSFQQDTDPTECDEVKRKLCKPCSVGHSQMVPAALQFQVDTSELTLVEKVEMVKKMNFEAADIFILMHRIKEGNDNAEPCKDSLSETEYPRTCEVILKWLQQLLSSFPSTYIRLDSCILKTLEHLRDNDFLISVFGRFNSGKSTLLNAVLASKCLPISEESETMMVVKIAHRRDIHPGCCKSNSCVQMCPLLEESKSKADCHTMALTENPTRGAHNIYEALKAVDRKVKEKQLEVTSQFTIKAHVPAIAILQEPWTVSLVDNPGFSADDDGVNSLARTAMATSHAFILTLDYNTIEDKMNTKTFQDIFRKDESIFDDNPPRLVIAVTHLDIHYQRVDEDEQLPLPELKKKAVDLVCEQVYKAVGVRISDEKVVPVFGTWALSARQLKYLPDDIQSRKRAERHLKQFFNGPSGEGQDMLADMSSKDVMELLEKESGIRRLEEKIQNMLKEFGKGWIRSVHADCLNYIEAALKALREKISLLDTVMKAQNEQYQQSLQHQQNIAHIQQGFGQNLQEDSSSPVMQQLTECYLQDVKGVSKSAKEELTEFEKQCRENLVEGCIPKQSFDSGLKNLLLKLKKLVERQGFRNIYEQLEGLREDAIQQKASLQTSAKEYCCHSGSSFPYLSKKVNELKSTVQPLVTLAGLKNKDIVEHRLNLQEIKRIHQGSAVLNSCHSPFDAKFEEGESQSIPQVQSITAAVWETIKRALHWWNVLLRSAPDADTCGSLRSPTIDSQAQCVAETESVANTDSEVPVVEYLSVHELEELIQRIHDGVVESMYKYFDEIQQEIIIFFFNNGYRDYVIHGLEEFSKQFSVPVKKQDREMKVMGAVLKELQEDADVLEAWCQNLIHLQKVLRPQAKAFYEKHFQSSQPELHVPKAGLSESSASTDTRFLSTDKPNRIKRNIQPLNTTNEILHPSQQDDAAQHSLNVHPGFKGPCVSNHSEALQGRVRIYWTLERRQRKQAVNCSDFQSDFKDDVLSTCEATALRLTAFNTVYPGLLAVFSAHLFHKWEQADKNRISISLFGHLASGKSMLMNAILTDSVLPIGKTVKSVEVRIRNNSQVHKGQCPESSDGKTCPQCPVLLKLTGTDVVAGGRGASNIARILQDIDEPPVDIPNVDEAKPSFIIEGFAPILDAACIAPWKVHLVENAGYKQLRNHKETKRFKREVEAANAYVFTIPYKDRRNEVHYELLGKLIEADESVFRENRITIVITYFEEWYIDDQRPTVQEVKDDICCSIKDRVGQCHIPEDCLIPVCGMWANTARRLQSTPSERTEASLQLERKARLYWKLYKKATSGRDANERLQPVEIASKLLVASGIKHVEQRVMTMAATCSEDSITVLCSNFNRRLKEAADYLDASSTVIKGFDEEKRSECAEFDTCYATITTHREQLRAKGNPEHVSKNMQCLKSIEEMGMRKCQEVLAQVSERDLPRLQIVLNEKLNDTSVFQSAWDICCSHSTDVTKILESMRETAARVVQPRSRARTIALQATEAGQVPENDTTPTVLNAKEFVERILRSTGSFKITENMRSTQGDQFKERILENFRGHIQIVAQYTLQHMKKYCLTVVENAIHGFEIEFEESLNQRNEETEMLKSETQKWSSEAQKIEEYRDHLCRLRKHLEGKAKECRLQWEAKRRNNPKLRV